MGDTMKDHKRDDKTRKIKINLKWVDGLFIILGLAALIGAVFSYTGRQNFINYCLAIIVCSFVLLYRIIDKGKYKVIKYILLFFGTMAAIFWSFYFSSFSYPVGSFRKTNVTGERLLQETEGFEKISISFRDGKLSGWLYRQSEEQEAPLFIFFCGAGECSADSMSSFYEEGNLMSYLPDYNFLCMDYPGYGDSDGRVYEAAMKSMALNVYDKAITLKGIDETRITVAGYSIGSGPASYLAMKQEVASLILIAPYDRIYHIEDADRTDLYQLVFGYRVNPYDYAKKIDERVLLLTSDADRTCEYKGAKRVADRLENCQLINLSGVKHENMLCDEAYKAISAFLKE